VRVDTLEAYDVPPEILGIWRSSVLASGMAHSTTELRALLMASFTRARYWAFP
jgi:hypothetical protein